MPMSLIAGKLTWARVMAWCCKEQAITSAIVKPYLCHHMASPDHNELIVEAGTKWELQTSFLNEWSAKET